MLEENMRAWAKKTEVMGMRKVLLQLMTDRFGRLPRQVRERVEEIASAREIQTLARRVLVAGSLDEMKLG